MGNVIQTNVASLNAQRNLFKTNIDLTTTFQRLSSGFRINSAKDDASGLFISNQLTSQIKGLNVAIRNAGDGISFSQTAEGGMQEITNILQRMRELAVQSANGTNGAVERDALNEEFSALEAEVARITDQTTFGARNVLDGTSGNIPLQVGINAGEQITITGTDLTTLSVYTAATHTISTSAGADAALAALDLDIRAVDSARAGLGAVQNRLISTIANLQSVIENASASRSRIRDTDFALETSNLSKNQVLQQAGLSVLGQANASGQGVLSLLQG
ncbi:flagellin [Aliikangiella sp. G2MR2-5]|uniref:flagellin N-terminal helical domain-containing protein n=1 Tax=Aliikangiella sp. G2MR2-5 TaxID=2788943 RepID=UPI0018A973BE|nr:flagellin [Aliikangiella sp. G2MR2-5]